MVSLILKYESCDFNVSLTLPICPNDVLSCPALLPSWVFFCAPQQTTSIFRTEVVMSSLSPPLHPRGKKFLPIDLTPQFWENLSLDYPWMGSLKVYNTLHQYESKRKRKEPTQRNKPRRGQEAENTISRPFSRGDECLPQGLVSAWVPWVAMVYNPRALICSGFPDSRREENPLERMKTETHFLCIRSGYRPLTPDCWARNISQGLGPSFHFLLKAQKCTFHLPVPRGMQECPADLCHPIN